MYKKRQKQLQEFAFEKQWVEELHTLRELVEKVLPHCHGLSKFLRLFQDLTPRSPLCCMSDLIERAAGGLVCLVAHALQLQPGEIPDLSHLLLG